MHVLFVLWPLLDFSRFLVSHLCLSSLLSCAPPHHQRPFLRYSCVHFVPLKFIELTQTAETQKIREALSAPLREMVLQRG